jgi:hypothetical protein
VKVLLDQDVPRRAAALLRERGVDAVHASEVGLGSARDADIVDLVRAQGAIAVTLDADIRALIALPGPGVPGCADRGPSPNREWLAERYEVFVRASPVVLCVVHNAVERGADPRLRPRVP